MRRLILVALLAGVSTGPALARENCYLNGSQPGVTVEFGFSFGGDPDDDGDVWNGPDAYDFDSDLAMIELRKRGVDPRSVSIASDGCIEAYVQNPDGSWRSDYYDPNTWEQVY